MNDNVSCTITNFFPRDTSLYHQMPYRDQTICFHNKAACAQEQNIGEPCSLLTLPVIPCDLARFNNRRHIKGSIGVVVIFMYTVCTTIMWTIWLFVSFSLSLFLFLSFCRSLFNIVTQKIEWKKSFFRISSRVCWRRIRTVEWLQKW